MLLLLHVLFDVLRSIANGIAAGLDILVRSCLLMTCAWY